MNETRQEPSSAEASEGRPETALPAGISREEYERWQRRCEVGPGAQAEVLPGPLAEAFDPQVVEVAGLKVRQLVHYDYVLLRRLDSPLYRRVLELGKPAEERRDVPFSDEEGYEIIVQFTRPCVEVKRLVDRLGRTGFREFCIEQIGMLSPGEVEVLAGAAVRTFVEGAATALRYRQASEGDGSFRLPPAGMRTGSDGGSITSAV